MNYSCIFCNYNTNRINNYNVHLKSKKHIKYSTIEKPIDEINNNICNFCFEKYSTKQSLNRHINICKKQSIETSKTNINVINEFKDKLREEIEELKEEIKELKEIKNVIIYNTTHTTNNIQNNITVVPYIHTNVEHITDDDIRKVINKKFLCVKELVSKKHFNIEKPEYMNISITNMNGKHMKIYKEDGWSLTDKANMINTLFVENEQTIEDRLNEINDPKLIEIFNKYKQYISNEVEYESLKKDLSLFIYNKSLKMNIGKK
jgi:hypothetical protein